MKKTIVALLVVCLALAMVSCHKHTFSDQWSFDNANHWHASTCGHDVTADQAAHTWDNGVVTKESTCTEEGVKTFTCTVCGATRTESVKATGHNYSGGVCTVCGDSLIEGEWKVDVYAFLEEYFYPQVKAEYESSSLSQEYYTYDEFKGGYEVEFAGEVFDNINTFSINFIDNKNCKLSEYGDTVEAAYSVSADGKLSLVAYGETYEVGEFNSDYTRLNLLIDGESVPMAKNPKEFVTLWPELLKDEEASAEVVKQLIANGADVGFGLYEGETNAVLFAIANCSEDVALVLLDYATADMVNVFDEETSFLLYYLYNFEEDASAAIVTKMLEKGATVEGTVDGDSFLDCTLSYCNEDVCLVVLDYATADQINAVNDSERTMLAEYLYQNEEDACASVVKKLIEKGASIDADTDGVPAFVYALAQCNEDVCLTMLDYVTVEQMTADYSGGTALAFYLYYNDQDATAAVVSKCIEKGAATDATFGNYTILSYAQNNCNEEVIAVLSAQ